MNFFSLQNIFSTMKFFLVKGAKVSFPAAGTNFNGSSFKNTTVTAGIFPTGSPNHFTANDCNTIKNLIEGKQTAPLNLPSERRCHPEKPVVEKIDNAKPVSWNLHLYLTLGTGGHRWDFKPSLINLAGETQGNVIERLSEVMKQQGFEIRVLVQIRNLGITVNGAEHRMNVLTNEMPISVLSTAKTFGCESQGLYLSGWGCLYEFASRACDGAMDIIVYAECTNVKWRKSFLEFDADICKKLLTEEIASDVSIVAKNGSVIKCHKSFLIAHSSVFASMFKEGFEEGKTNTVEMPDMAEESLKAFLEYLYFKELKEAHEHSNTAFELLEAGHKYDIKDLEVNMRNILLTKPESWFEGEVSLRLFLFSRNIEDGQELKVKAVKLIKLMYESIKTTENYKELLKKDPDALLELLECSFSM